MGAFVLKHKHTPLSMEISDAQNSLSNAAHNDKQYILIS
jgi:hypothetical protein